jgi:uncharacterized Zn-binding protein involved in type VI secretion
VRGIARLDDETIGVCYCHDDPITVSGRIITASDDHYTNGRGTARLGDTVLANCGHTGVIVTSKETEFVNNRGIARLEDEFEGCYIGKIVTASEDTF